ncbi:hypothetical protein Stube_13500 [Streptomyces tubercidicus]|uniref:Uncharacterized protein n=1 Tax=Streptomyces tubercidicus TaxID=47759 RepID=A0A640ULJ2_9ACTN|nr:hypothetical protein Stube_13500 [Streptomyces tubercidicus]
MRDRVEEMRNTVAGPRATEPAQRMPVPALGSVLTVAMALITDRPGTLVELLRPRGLEVG